MKLPARELAGLTLGIELVLSVVFVGALGRWADRRFGTEPTLLLVGVVLGAAAGFRQIYRFTERMDRSNHPPKAHEMTKTPEGPKQP